MNASQTIFARVTPSTIVRALRHPDGTFTHLLLITIYDMVDGYTGVARQQRRETRRLTPQQQRNALAALRAVDSLTRSAVEA